MPALDDDRCYQALVSRDARFDGWFLAGVTSTGIYCRASCPTPVHPLRTNVRFYPTAAAAQRAGFRACKRCRPDAAPGSPEWDRRADLVGRAMRLIADGVVDREGVPRLAARLAVSDRHLRRVLEAELGAGPLALARANRAQTARVLIETTEMTLTDVAFAAGFSSVRQFNDTIREVFATSPTNLRRRSGAANAPAGAIDLRLPVRPPFDASWLFGFLAGHTPTAVGTGDTTWHRRSLRLPKGPASVELSLPPGECAPAAVDHVRCRLRLAETADLAVAVARCRRLLDLDADPVGIATDLAADPVLAHLGRRFPGLRVPGAVDGFEAAVGAIVGQQVSVAGAATILDRLVQEAGRAGIAGDTGIGDAVLLFPTAGQVAAMDLSGLGLTATRRGALAALAAAVTEGRLDLDPGADRDRTRADLLELPGVGPWTAEVICLRALGDPDVGLTTDLAVRQAASQLDIDDLDGRAKTWSPWRSYAALLLWAHRVGHVSPTERGVSRAR